MKAIRFKRNPAKKKRKPGEIISIEKPIKDGLRPAGKNKRSEAAKLREERKKEARKLISRRLSPVYCTQTVVSRPWTGLKLQRARMAVNMSLRQLSRETGIPPATLWATENGRLWSKKTHDAYARVLTPILMKNPEQLAKLSNNDLTTGS